jgi:hypothetical protein
MVGSEAGGKMITLAPITKCPHCGLDKQIRNPSGYCDHLYYPESCEVCQKLLKAQQEQYKKIQQMRKEIQDLEST